LSNCTDYAGDADQATWLLKRGVELTDIREDNSDHAGLWSNFVSMHPLVVDFG
jgi:hypothetical protein